MSVAGGLSLVVYAEFGHDGAHVGIGSVAVGRELVVRVDLADRQRVAVDWDQSLRLRQASD